MTTPNENTAPPRPVLEELRLARFKSFMDARLPLQALTLLIGRNGSGKSNAIDALQVLSRLAPGEEIREAVEGGRRDGPAAVRGGVEGCAPIGGWKDFAIGCTVAVGSERFHLDVTIEVEPEVLVKSERLCRGNRTLLETDPPDSGSGDISTRYFNGKRGPNPSVPFRRNRLLTSQVGARVPLDDDPCKEVHEAADAVVAALDAIFILDPVPSLMRQYVPARDHLLRRQADNVSAAIANLRTDAAAWEQLLELLRSLPEQRVEEISIVKSSLGDVMVALKERIGKRKRAFPARLMSDGMLRFLAIAVALLEAPLATDGDDEAAEAETMLVIEEIENGLHPSQAAKVVRLVKAESERRRVRTLATTHSPAILSALEAHDHRGVVVCDRDPNSGWSRMRPLVDLPGYARAMATGSLGDAVTSGRLSQTEDGESVEDLRALLESL